MNNHGNSRVYNLGATQAVVGLSATVVVELQKVPYAIGGWLKIYSGAGTLSIVSGPSNIVSQGVLIGATDTFEIEGPAKFYLAAAAATMTVGIGIRYGQGLSSAVPV